MLYCSDNKVPLFPVLQSFLQVYEIPAVLFVILKHLLEFAMYFSVLWHDQAVFGGLLVPFEEIQP